jgi:hypothetical protein
MPSSDLSELGFFVQRMRRRRRERAARVSAVSLLVSVGPEIGADGGDGEGTKNSPIRRMASLDR